ncbi:MAG: hypothetical protein ACFFCT_02850 [Candidatus Odinarchaeota archaeon]
MIDSETERIIEDYIKKTSRLLPDSFAAEDLIADLKSHIYEALAEKIRNNPTESQVNLIQDVLNGVGTPEDIAEEYELEQIVETEQSANNDRFQYYVIRLVAAFVVAVLAAWVVSTITNGAVDFYFAVLVLMAFAVIEWFVRAKQIGES